MALAAGGLGWPAYVKGPCPQSRMGSALGTNAWFCAGPGMVCLEDVGSLQLQPLTKQRRGGFSMGDSKAPIVARCAGWYWLSCFALLFFKCMQMPLQIAECRPT